MVDWSNQLLGEMFTELKFSTVEQAAFTKPELFAHLMNGLATLVYVSTQDEITILGGSERMGIKLFYEPSSPKGLNDADVRHKLPTFKATDEFKSLRKLYHEVDMLTHPWEVDPVLAYNTIMTGDEQTYYKIRLLLN